MSERTTDARVVRVSQAGANRLVRSTLERSWQGWAEIIGDTSRPLIRIGFALLPAPE